MEIALKRVLTLLQWIIIGLLAFYILKYIAPVAFIVGLFFMFWKQKVGSGIDKLSTDLRSVSYCFDLLGNVTIFNWLWFLFKKKEGRKFGNCTETISFVLQRNYEKETLTNFGLWWYKFIQFIDPEHFEGL